MTKNNKNQIKNFVKTILSTANFSDSCKHFYSFDKNSNLKRERFFRQNDNNNIDENVDKLFIEHDKNYYVTKNSFSTLERNSNSLFSLDNIVIDIDNHDSQAKGEDIDFEIKRLLFFIKFDYQGKLPEFNYVMTGRGIQIWIGLESCHAKLSFVYNALCRYFCDILSVIIQENNINLEVDYSASCNAVGIVRLPYTYNFKRKGFECKFCHLTNEKYSVQDLQEEYSGTISKFKNSETSTSNYTSNDNILCGDKKYAPLNYKRKYFIEKIVDDCSGLCDGRRNNILFMYFNALVQIMSFEKAVAYTESLNGKFSNPLKDISYIFKYFKKLKGFVKESKVYFAKILNLSEAENKTYDEIVSKRESERRIAREKKNERDNRILNLFKSGISKTEIARIVGCHRNTITNIIKKFSAVFTETTSDTTETELCNDNTIDENVVEYVEVEMPETEEDFVYNFNIDFDENETNDTEDFNENYKQKQRCIGGYFSNLYIDMFCT